MGSARYTDRPNGWGCFEPECEDSTFDHPCPVVPPITSDWWEPRMEVVVRLIPLPFQVDTAHPTGLTQEARVDLATALARSGFRTASVPVAMPVEQETSD